MTDSERNSAWAATEHRFSRFLRVNWQHNIPV